jgi:hypothetical protein
MKKSFLIVMMVSAVFISVAAHKPEEPKKASEQLAHQVIFALRLSSSSDFINLMPTLEEFKQIMKSNEVVYGAYLTEAQEDFSINYETIILPAVKESFTALTEEGSRRGINWREITLVRVESEENQFLDAATISIVIASEGREFKIVMERALLINGQWKVSQFVKLV